ncbi:MAG: hypothetical protein Q9182_002806 [Xanthomendoza sp. 2 TL-2023]
MSPDLKSPSSTALGQNTLLDGSTVLTVTYPDSMRSLTTRVTTVGVSAIKTLPLGDLALRLPTTTTDFRGQLVVSTATRSNGSFLNPQDMLPGSTTTAAAGAQESSKDAQASVSSLPTKSSNSTASAPALDQSDTGQVLGLTTSTPAFSVSLSKPSQPGSKQNLDTSKASGQTRQDGTALAVSGSSPMLTSSIQDRPVPSHSSSTSDQESLTTPKASSAPPFQMSASSSGLQSLPSVGLVSTQGGSSPLLLQQTLATPTRTGGTNVGQAAPTQKPERSTTGLGTSSSLGSPELPVSRTPTIAPSLSALETSMPGVSQAASPMRNNSGAPALSVPVVIPLNSASATSSFGLGDLVTTQITNGQGPPIPAVVVLTTNLGGSTITSLVPIPPTTVVDSNPTSTMTTIPPGLSVEKATNPVWTTNTWITTTAPGRSDATIVPVLVGCPGCGGRGHGLVIWNLPNLPRVQFRFPNLPDVPRFHIPCIKIFGIRLGSCSDPSKLPEIITDPPEPSDPKPQPGSDKNPSDTADKDSNPTDKQSSTASEPTSTSKPSSITTSSASTSSSSSSTSSCPNGVTISDTTICNVPTLKAVVDRQVQPGASVAQPTGSKKPRSKTHRVVSVASITSFIPSNQTSVPMSFVISIPSSVTASMSSRKNSTLPLFKPTGGSSTVTKSPQSSSSSTSSLSTTSTTPTPQTNSSPPPKPTSTPPTISPVDPPSPPTCHPAPIKPYTDVHPPTIESVTDAFCTAHNTQILHADSSPITSKFLFTDSSDIGHMSVEWIKDCASAAEVDGYTIGHPSLRKDGDGCVEILRKTFWGCTANKGRGGCITAGCLQYCLSAGSPSIVFKKPCVGHPCKKGE